MSPEGKLIRLPARIGDDLKWVVSEEKQVIWELDFGLHLPDFPLDDELLFASLALAADHFTKVFWPLVKEQTVGVAIYRGPCVPQMKWGERQEENWSLWKEKEFPDLFAIESFATYFQMLAHRLPDELPICLLFDEEGLSLPRIALLLSKERFSHFHVATRKSTPFIWGGEWMGRVQNLPISALCLPEKIDRELLQRLESIPTGRIVSELFLTEEWEGLETLYVLEGSLSSSGKRKLKGFEAAGGTVVEIQ